MIQIFLIEITFLVLWIFKLRVGEISEFRDHGGCLFVAQKLVCMKSLTPEVPSEDATKMCVIHYNF